MNRIIDKNDQRNYRWQVVIFRLNANTCVRTNANQLREFKMNYLTLINQYASLHRLAQYFKFMIAGISYIYSNVLFAMDYQIYLGLLQK